MADQQDVQTPKLEDLPKVAENLKSQLEHFNTGALKDVETQEKVVLPTAEGDYIFSQRIFCIHQHSTNLF